MTLYFNTRKNPDIQISFKGFRPSAKAIRIRFMPKVIRLPTHCMAMLGRPTV